MSAEQPLDPAIMSAKSSVEGTENIDVFRAVGGHYGTRNSRELAADNRIIGSLADHVTES
jgi:hypothetical protein